MLKPIVPCLSTCVKDDWCLLQLLLSSWKFDSVLYSCDIESLCTSIPINLGIEAIHYSITRKHNLIPELVMKKFIIYSIKFNLKINNCFFDSKMSNQVFGTAIRTKCTPPYAFFAVRYQEET